MNTLHCSYASFDFETRAKTKEEALDRLEEACEQAGITMYFYKDDTVLEDENGDEVEENEEEEE